MAYVVEGIIAERAVLERHRNGDYGWAKVAPLNQGFGIVPVDKTIHPFIEAKYREGYATALRDMRLRGPEVEQELAKLDYIHDFKALWGALEAWLLEMSNDGPVAAISIQCFGGICAHGAVVCADGRLTHGPAVMESASSTFDNPVNQALRTIGVEVGDAHDAFAAVGLSKYRSREDWEAVAR